MTRAPLLLVLLPTIALCRAALGADFPPLENPASLPAQSIAPGKEARLALPALPQRPKRVAVLRFRAVIVSGGEGGCNYNAAVAVNENTLGARTATGDRRLLGRDSSFELGSMRDSDFPVFGPGSVMVMYAPDIARGDAMATDGLGATFALDISDIARGGDGNTVTFRNILTYKMPEGLGALRVEGIEVGWLDRAALPRPKTAVPTRGAVASHVTAGGITLSQSTRGGFTIRTADGPELLVETAMSAAPGAVATLIADDGAPQPPDTEVTVRQWGQAGFEVAVTCLEGVAQCVELVLLFGAAGRLGLKVQKLLLVVPGHLAQVALALLLLH